MYNYQNESKLTQFSTILFMTLVEFFVSVFVIYFITYTFGAYLFENVLETLIFSALMSMLCVMPLLIACKHQNPLILIDRVLLKNEFESKLEQRLTNVAYGAVLGAWLGALVIPLDWDRWWQEWPVSCVAGGVCGAVCGGLADRIKLRFKTKLNL